VLTNTRTSKNESALLAIENHSYEDNQKSVADAPASENESDLAALYNDLYSKPKPSFQP
jgi:hypothetical protein